MTEQTTIFQPKIKATIKVYEQISPDELITLINGLRNIKGFDFSVDTQTKIK